MKQYMCYKYIQWVQAYYTGTGPSVLIGEASLSQCPDFRSVLIRGVPISQFLNREVPLCSPGLCYLVVTMSSIPAL